MAELRAHRRRLFFFFLLLFVLCFSSNTSKITNTQPTRRALLLSTHGDVAFVTFPTYTAFDDISFSCKSCCRSYRDFAPCQHICPSTYLKIGSLKFTLMTMWKEQMNVAPVERLFSGLRSFVRVQAGLVAPRWRLVGNRWPGGGASAHLALNRRLLRRSANLNTFCPSRTHFCCITEITIRDRGREFNESKERIRFKIRRRARCRWQLQGRGFPSGNARVPRG